MIFIDVHIHNVLSKLKANRVLSVDILRGIAITGMILVNNPGSWSHIYWPLEHAKWNSWTPTDVIFPLFLFVVGISISISVSKLNTIGIKRKIIVKQAILRTLKLFFLGWFLALFYYNFYDSSFSWMEDRFFSIRVMGVLQRIALVYFVSVLVYLFMDIRSVFTTSVSILIVYILLMQNIHYSAPDGTVYSGLWIEGNNLAAWLDQYIFGIEHLYSKTTPFASDPEGLLSTLPAISTCLSGILVSHYLNLPNRNQNIPVENITSQSTMEINANGVGNVIGNQDERNLLKKKLTILLVNGFLLILLGYLLTIMVPINKSLWTPSYVLVTSGVAIILLSLISYIVEIKNKLGWAVVFIVFGMNSIGFFMFAGIMGRLIIMIKIGEYSIKQWLYENLFQPYAGDYMGSLLFAISFLGISYLLMYWLYKRSIFWKV